MNIATCISHLLVPFEPQPFRGTAITGGDPGGVLRAALRADNAPPTPVGGACHYVKRVVSPTVHGLELGVTKNCITQHIHHITCSCKKSFVTYYY